MKILLIRGAFLNRYEGQNYEVVSQLLKKKGHSFSAIGSFASFHTNFTFPVKLLFSPYDIAVWFGSVPIVGTFFAKYYLAFCNRTIGDGHFLLGLERFIKKTGPYDTVIIAETYYGFDRQVAELKKEGHVRKIVSTCWETIAHNNETVEKKNVIKNLAKKYIDQYICPTELARNALLAEGIHPNHVAIVRVGIDLKKFAPEVSPHEDFRVAFIGRKTHEKGIGDFRKLATILRLINSNYTVIELSSVSYDQMPRELSMIDCVVIPSRTTKTMAEQYSMVAVESMACGKVIVAYATGALSEVIADAGIIVKDGDVQGLADAVETVAQNIRLRTEYQRKARERADKYYDRKKVGYDLLRFMI